MAPRRPDNFDYQRYLASREWSLLREQVRQRSGNQCEHCFAAPQQAVHHLTYERLGSERLADLMAICNPCHAYLSGKSSENPQNDKLIVTPPFKARFWKDGWAEHFVIPIEEGPVRSVMCHESGCVWCGYQDADWPIFMSNLHKVRRQR